MAQENIYQKALDSLNIFLEEQLLDNEPGAALVISHQGHIIFEEYYGTANVLSKERLSAEHLMGIASMSKQFEGMAVLILVEQGKLGLKDDIKSHLPELPIEEGRISISQLLSHTSGLPELTQDIHFMHHLDKKRSVQEIIDLAFIQDIRHEPGERYQYCNTGYTIMEKVIEKVSGMSYATFLKKHLFEPLQMKHTYCCDLEHDAQNIADRYLQDSTSIQLAEYIHFSNLIGGGGIISNARDMHQWNNALLNGHHLPKNYQKLWESILLNNGSSTNYGLGMGISSHQGHPFYYHPGMGSGMNSINLIFPEQQMGIVIIRNVSNPSLSSVQLAMMIADLLIE